MSAPPATGAPKPKRATRAARKSRGDRPRHERVLEFLGALTQPARKDPLSTFLLLASIGLTILFFALLGSIEPKSPGREVPLSQAYKLAQQQAAHRRDPARPGRAGGHGRSRTAPRLGGLPQIGRADLLAAAPALARPASPSTSTSSRSCRPAGSSSSSCCRSCCWSACSPLHADRPGRRRGRHSRRSRSSPARAARRRARPERITFDDVAGAGEARRRAARDPRLPRRPDQVRGSSARARRRACCSSARPGTGKTLLAKATAGEADASFFSLSGSDFVESLVGVGAARVRDLFAQGAQDGAGDHLHRRARRRRAQARRRHRPGQRRARADAQPAAGRDGRLRRRRPASS